MLIRRAEPSDLDAMQQIGKACVPGIPSTDRSALKDLYDIAYLALIGELSGIPAGFAIVLDEQAPYGSLNFAWFRDRHQQFAYVDRIGALPDSRGSGLGRALYMTIFQLAGEQKPYLCCEVNARPPNPDSLAFHEKLGFKTVGRADYGPEKSVTFMELALPSKTG